MLGVLSPERLRLQLELLWYDVRSLIACSTSDEWSTDKENIAGLDLVARNISSEPVLSQKCTFRASLDPRTFCHLVASEDLEARKCWIPTLQSFERLQTLPRVNEDEEMHLDRAVMSSFVSRPIEYKMLSCVRADGGSEAVHGCRTWVLLSQPLRNLVQGLRSSEETIPAKTTMIAFVAAPVAVEGGAVHSEVTVLHQHEMYAGSNPFQLLLRAVHAKATRTALRTCLGALKDLCATLPPDAVASLVPPCPSAAVGSPSRSVSTPHNAASPKVDPASYQDAIMFSTMASPEFRQLRSKHAAGEIPLGHFLEASLPVEEVSQHFGQMRLRQFADIKARAAAAAFAAVADLPEESAAELLGLDDLAGPSSPPAPPPHAQPPPPPPQPAPAPPAAAHVKQEHHEGWSPLALDWDEPAGHGADLPTAGAGARELPTRLPAVPATEPGTPTLEAVLLEEQLLAVHGSPELAGTVELPAGGGSPAPFVQWVMPVPIPVVVNPAQLATLFPANSAPPRLTAASPRARARHSYPPASLLPERHAPLPLGGCGAEERRRFVNYEAIKIGGGAWMGPGRRSKRLRDMEHEAVFLLEDAGPPVWEADHAAGSTPLFVMDL